MKDVLRQVCLLSEGVAADITDIGTFPGMNAQVVLEVVPLAVHVLLVCAFGVTALEEYDSSLTEWAFELISFVVYFPHLVANKLSILLFGVGLHDEHWHIDREFLKRGAILAELACRGFVPLVRHRQTCDLDMCMFVCSALS